MRTAADRLSLSLELVRDFWTRSMQPDNIVFSVSVLPLVKFLTRVCSFPMQVHRGFAPGHKELDSQDEFPLKIVPRVVIIYAFSMG